jgi:hypothetical protein
VAGTVGRKRGLAGLLDGLLDKLLSSRLLQRVASPAVSYLRLFVYLYVATVGRSCPPIGLPPTVNDWAMHNRHCAWGLCFASGGALGRGKLSLSLGLRSKVHGGVYAVSTARPLVKHILMAVSLPLCVQVMARVGRGALVGLPAVGALFVAHLAHQDWHRLTEERAAGAYSPHIAGSCGT